MSLRQGAPGVCGTLRPRGGPAGLPCPGNRVTAGVDAAPLAVLARDHRPDARGQLFGERLHAS
ncbi:hypothetical protein ACFPN0_19120 [Kitasatospora cinereorecta]